MDAGARAERIQDVVGTDDAKPFALDLADNRGEQPIVAEGAGADPRQRLRRAPVRPQFAEAGTPDRPDHADLVHPCGAQQPERLGHLPQPDPAMGNAVHCPRIGLALEGKDEDLAPLGTRRRDHAGGQTAPAREHAQARRHFSIFGSVTARISAPRMNSMIDRTGWFSG